MTTNERIVALAGDRLGIEQRHVFSNPHAKPDDESVGTDERSAKDDLP